MQVQKPRQDTGAYKRRNIGNENQYYKIRYINFFSSEGGQVLMRDVGGMQMTGLQRLLIPRLKGLKKTNFGVTSGESEAEVVKEGLPFRTGKTYGKNSYNDADATLYIPFESRTREIKYGKYKAYKAENAGLEKQKYILHTITVCGGYKVVIRENKESVLTSKGRRCQMDYLRFRQQLRLTSFDRYALRQTKKTLYLLKTK